MVAIVRKYQPSQVEQPSRVVPVQASQTSIGNLGAGLQAAGDAAWTFEDEIATAHAYQVDADFTNFMRETMHGNGEDKAGYLSAKGFDAVNGREAVIKQVEDQYRQMAESLNPRVRASAVRSLEARFQTFLGQVNKHSTAQARAGAARAAGARVDASKEAALRAAIMGDNAGFEQNIAAIEATGADLYPNDPEMQAAYVQENTSSAYSAVASGLAEEAGADAAWSFVEANQERFRTKDLAKVADAYRDGALVERGTAAADAAVAEIMADPFAQPETSEGEVEATPAPTASGFVDPPKGPKLEFAVGGRQITGVNPFADAPLVEARPAGAADAPPGVGGLSFPPAPVPAISAPEPNVVEPPTFTAPDWSAAREKVMEIANPRAREAALQRLDEQEEAFEKQMQEVHDAALTQAQQIILDNEGKVGAVERVPAELLVHLTPAEKENLHAFARTVRSNRDPETPDDVYARMHLLYEQGDAVALDQLLKANAHQISKSDSRTFSARVAALKAGERTTLDDVQWAEINTEVTRAMGNFGITAANNPSARRLLDNEVRRWVSSYVQRNEKAPNRDEVFQRANELMMVQVEFDGHRGLGTSYEGSAFNVDIGGVNDDGGRNDLSLDRLVTAAKREQLTINNVPISSDDLAQVQASLAAQTGREPTLDELWTALIIATGG